MSADDKGEPREVELGVHLRVIIHGGDVHVDSRTVFCPRSSQSRALGHCLRCPRFLKLEPGDAALHCLVEGSAVGLAQSPVAALALGTCICLDPELEVGEAAGLLAARALASAPVVDDSGVLVGVVEAAALLEAACEDRERHGYDFGAWPTEVEDAMSSVMCAISQNASVGEAARLMVQSGFDRLPIVTADAEVVGTICAMDLVRWLAGLSLAPRPSAPRR